MIDDIVKDEAKGMTYEPFIAGPKVEMCLPIDEEDKVCEEKKTI